MIRITAVIAFICGDIPPLPVIDHISIGKVLKPGPVVNNVFTRSSNDRANVNKAADRIAGQEIEEQILKT